MCQPGYKGELLQGEPSAETPGAGRSRFPNQSPLHTVTGSKARSQTILTHANRGCSGLPLTATQPAPASALPTARCCGLLPRGGGSPALPEHLWHCRKTHSSDKGQAGKGRPTAEEALWLSFQHSYNLSFSRKPTVSIRVFLQR